MPIARKKIAANAQRLVVVTGAGGFVGSHVRRQLDKYCRTGRRILIFRKSPRFRQIAPGEEIVIGDLNHYGVWRSLPDNVTHVIHLAAVKPSSSAGDKEMMRRNLVPVKHLCRRSKRWPMLRQIVMTSSVSVYPWTGRRVSEKSGLKPVNGYGTAKLRAEREIGRSRPSIRKCILRLSSVYGPDQDPDTVIPRMIKQASKNNSVEIFGSGKRVMDFIHVQDAAHAICTAFKNEAYGIYNVGSGVSSSMRSLAAEVLKRFATGRSGKLVVRRNAAGGGPGLRLSTAKAFRAFGRRPMKLDKGLALMKISKTAR